MKPAESYPLVTVLMPVYNGERFVSEAVSSILLQTFKDFELIIIDDGSKDSTLDILGKISDSRIRLLKNNKNLGLIATLNRGLSEARGKYSARMDADDVSLPDRLIRQIEYLESHPSIDVVGSAVELIDERGDRFSSINYPTEPNIIRELLYLECCLVHPSVMFRTNVVRDLGGYSISARNAEDYELWLRLSDNHLIANLSERLVKYRVHSAQVSITNLADQYNIIQEFRRKTAVRRQAAGEKVLDLTLRAIAPNLFKRLIAAPCTLGADYINWCKQYILLGKPNIALSFSINSLKNSPLSVDAWNCLFTIAFISIIPSTWRRAARWYAKRAVDCLSLTGKK